MTSPSGSNLYTLGSGTKAENVEIPTIQQRPPTTADINWPQGKRWVYAPGNSEYTLTSFQSFNGQILANWSVLGGGTSEVNQLTANTGTAIPSGGTIQIAGTGGISTSASGNVITVQISSPAIFGTIEADTFETSDPANALNITGNSISGQGTNPSVSVVIAPKGTGVLNVSTSGTPKDVYANNYITNGGAGDFVRLGDTDLLAIGASTDITINIGPKGSGFVNITDGSTFYNAKALSWQTSDATNALSMSGNSVSAIGSATDIPVILSPKGAGAVNVSTSGTPKDIYADGFITAGGTGAAFLLMNSNEVLAEGSNAAIDIKIGPKGTGSLLVTQDSSTYHDVVCSKLLYPSQSQPTAGSTSYGAGGTVTINTTEVTNQSVIAIMITVLAGTGITNPLPFRVTITNGVSFDVTSADANDRSAFNWIMFN